MSVNVSNSSGVTLDNCDKEPITVPGSIQPYSYLIVIDERLGIVGFSQNLLALLELTSEQLLSTSLVQLTALEFDYSLLDKVPSQGTLRINQKTYYLSITNSKKNLVCLEFECTASNIDLTYRDDDMLRNVVETLNCNTTMQELFDSILTIVKKFSSYDRCLLYRFDKDWNGEIVAESKEQHLETFKGLHYPHTDIPKQARKLYTLKLVRLIEDVDYSPVPLITQPDLNEDIDLTWVDSRSISPMHIMYLKNMGVKATLVMSLMVRGKLWGLIACHHYTSSKRLNYRERQTCSSLATLMSLFIEKKINEFNAQRSLSMANHLSLSDLVECIENPGSNKKYINQILATAGADGFVLVQGDNLFTQGVVPSHEDILRLLSLQTKDSKIVFITSLEEEFSIPMTSMQSAGACILPLSVGQGRKQHGMESSYVLLFRRAVTQVVNWAGDPKLKETINLNDVSMLSPRRSFALWKEIMKNRCKEWTDSDQFILEQFYIRLKEAATVVAQKRQDYELRVISETSDIGVWRLDLNTGSLFWNETMFEIYGVKPNEFDGNYQTWKNFLIEEERDSVSSLFEKCINSKKDFQTIFHINHPVMGVRVIRVHSKCIYSSSGVALNVVGTNFDITDDIWNLDGVDTEHLKQSEQNRLITLGEMAATIGHEINNPLAIIQNSLELQLVEIEKSNLSTSLLNKHNGRALSATKRIQKIVSGLKSVTKRSLSSPHEFCDVRECINEIVDLMNELYGNRGYLVEARLALLPIRVKISQTALQQVLVNLISNSVYALQNSEGKSIIIDGKKVGGRYTIMVKDEGVGITQDNLEKIFQPFYTTKGAGEGTGLGLSVAKRIISESNGELSVSSTKGVGTEVTISLDISESIPPSMAAESTNSCGRPMLEVMIVDDEPDVREVLALQVSALGHNVTCADNGAEAIKLIHYADFDYLLIDSQMPKTSGEEVITHLPEGIKTKIALMTGDVTKSKDSLRKEGVKVDELLTKPFGIIQLESLFALM